MGVSLAKGQSVSLAKPSGGSLTKVVMGLGWDVAKKKGFFGRSKDGNPIDLDASCVMFDAAKNAVDSIWFRQKQSKDGSIFHTGDNLTGAGDGDDEQIKVNLEAVPANVQSLVFTVCSFTGQTFATVENATCRIVDDTTNTEVARYDLSSAGGSHTAQIMAKVVRDGAGWRMEAIGENTNGRTILDLMPAMVQNI